MAEREEIQEPNNLSFAASDHPRHADEQSHEVKEQQERGVTQEQQASQVIVKVVLTANNHLGRDIAGQRRREERLQRLRNAFQQATSFAVAQGADIFIQAGDLFDTITPDERDRAFVASCLARLKQAGIPVVALGGTHDTPIRIAEDATVTSLPPAPQRSYAQLGALHYFSPLPNTEESEPLFLDIHGLRVGIVGVGWRSESSETAHADTAHQRDALFARIRSDVERAPLPLLILHSPIAGSEAVPPRFVGRDKILPMERDAIAQQTAFRVILDGYSHLYSRTRLGNAEVIAAGSSQSDATEYNNEYKNEEESVEKAPEPGFVYLGLTPDGIRWCNHIPVDALLSRQLTIAASDLWPDDATVIGTKSPTTLILERLEPLCSPEAMVRLRLVGEVTRSQYHQLNLNTIRHYGEQHCFSLAIDDGSVTLLSEHHEYTDSASSLAGERGERFSLREEVIALVDSWIADASQNEQERNTLLYVKEDVLAALDSAIAR